MATVAPEIEIPILNLPETDGIPLDSPWHRDEINLLVELVRCRFLGQNDFFVGGNMFIYYSFAQVRNRQFLGPDFMFVRGVDRHQPRRYWAVWEENGKYPNVIVELLSESTAREDRTRKKLVYEQTFRTPEYYLYDPDTRDLEGWRLSGERYQLIRPNHRGWLWSDQLELWLGTWEGEYVGELATWLRLYDPQEQLVLLGAETEHQRAEAECQRAEAEHQRAEAERQRAEAAETELARLKSLLTQQGTTGQIAGESTPGQHS